MEHESRTGVHEDTYHNGHQTDGQHEDIQNLVRHHQRSNDAEQNGEHKDQGDVAGVLEVVGSEERQIGDERDEDDQDEDGLPNRLIRNLGVADVATLIVLLVGMQHIIHLFGHSLATIHNLLSSLHKSVIARNALQELVQLLIRLHLVVEEVLLNEFVDVILLQDQLRVSGGVLLHDVGISGTQGEHLTQRHRDSHIIMNLSDALVVLRLCHSCIVI